MHTITFLRQRHQVPWQGRTHCPKPSPRHTNSSQEHEEGRIDLPDDEPAIIKLMIDYIYSATSAKLLRAMCAQSTPVNQVTWLARTTVPPASSVHTTLAASPARSLVTALYVTTVTHLPSSSLAHPRNSSCTLKCTRLATSTKSLGLRSSPNSSSSSHVRSSGTMQSLRRRRGVRLRRRLRRIGESGLLCVRL
jgi:hypothetical protein